MTTACAAHPQTGVTAASDTPGRRAEADHIEQTRQGQGDEDAAGQASEADRVHRHVRRAGRSRCHNRHRRQRALLAVAANAR